MQSLGTVDLSIWGNYEFSEEQTEVFEEHFQTLDDVMDFYNTWKRLSIKSAAFNEAGIKPGEAIAQTLAMEWTEMVQKVTGGNFEHERAEPFLEEALNIYNQKQE